MGNLGKDRDNLDIRHEQSEGSKIEWELERNTEHCEKFAELEHVTVIQMCLMPHMCWRGATTKAQRHALEYLHLRL